MPAGSSRRHSTVKRRTRDLANRRGGRHSPAGSDDGDRGASARTDREVRFVGLLGSAAYRQSVFMIPVIGGHADGSSPGRRRPVENHTGRAVRNVIETLPRDVLFELGVDELTHLVEEIVGLQERRIVRVFDVAEPVGPWTTVFVYVPSSRFTAALPEQVAALVGDTTAARPPTSRRSSGQFACSHLDDRPRRSPSRPDPLAGTSTTCRGRGVSVPGSARRRARRDRGPSSLVGGGRLGPADYEARVRPEAAIGDLVNIEAMLSGHTTS